MLRSKTVVAYNADFDQSLLAQSCHAYQLPPIETTWVCAMEAYAAYCGDWSRYWEDYRWQPLPGGDHTAIGDCRATLRLLQGMAATVPDFTSDFQALTVEFPQSN